MTFGFIYKIQFPNGKHYIGLTSTSLERRTKEHKWSAKSDNTKILYKALRKYEMLDTFELIEIDTADTLKELFEKEIGYILTYNSYYLNGKGYNMTWGGEGNNGYVYTEDDRQKMSASRKKDFENNPDAVKENSEALKKYYKDNPESIKKNSEAQKKRSPEWIIKKLDAQGKNKPFDMFTKNGVFIKTFAYQFEAIEYLQKEHHITSTINTCDVLAGRRKSSVGFIFKYK